MTTSFDHPMVKSTTFLMVALGLLSSALFPTDLWAQGGDELKRGVVKITAQVEGKTKVGTGVVVRTDKDAAYIVTAAHVIEGDPKPTVTLFSSPQQTHVAQVVGIEGGDPHGLAALRVAGPIPDGVVALPLDLTTKVVGGEALMFIGFPRTLPPWTVSTGSLSGMKGPTLAFQALVEEGHSGGPLLLNGQVIGIVSDTRSRLGYAVPASILAVALRGWRIEPRASDSMVPQEKIGADGVSMVLIRSGRIPTKVVAAYGGGLVEEVEAPPLSVYVADDFYIDKSLVTVKHFKEFLEATGRRVIGAYGEARDWSGDQNQAIDDVRWHDAVAYCTWARKRLPTEDEWEKAAHDTEGHILDPNVTEWTSSPYYESRFAPGDASDKSPKTIRGSLSAFHAKPMEGSQIDYQVRKHARPGEGFEGFRCVEEVRTGQ